MLLYNKSIDPLHTFVRIASVISILGNVTVEKDKLRLFDFLISNPEYIVKIKLPQELLKEKNSFKCFKNKYRNYNAKNLFDSMKPVQDIVFLNMINFGVLETKDSNESFTINLEALSGEVEGIINSNDNSVPKQALEFISKHLCTMSLLGSNGLKARSGLMEYKYDFI